MIELQNRKEKTYMEEFSAKKLRRSSNRAGMMLIAFTALIFAVSFVTDKAFPALLDESSPNYNALTTILLFLIQYIIIVPLVMVIFRFTPLGKALPGIKPLFCKPKQSLWFVLRWVVIILGFTYGANLATNIFIMLVQLLTGFEIYSLTIGGENTLFSQVTTSFAIMILAPVFEELFFRADIFGDMKRHGGWSVIVFTGLMFGLWHCNFQQIPLAAVLGTGSAFLLMKTGSIFPSFLVHFCLNTVGAISNIIVGYLDMDEYTEMLNSAASDPAAVMSISLPVIAQLCLVMFIMAVIGAAVFLLTLEIIFKRDSFKLGQPFPEVPEIKKFLICFSAPATIITVLIFIAMTVVNALGM